VHRGRVKRRRGCIYRCWLKQRECYFFIILSRVGCFFFLEIRASCTHTHSHIFMYLSLSIRMNVSFLFFFVWHCIRVTAVRCIVCLLRLCASSFFSLLFSLLPSSASCILAAFELRHRGCGFGVNWCLGGGGGQAEWPNEMGDTNSKKRPNKQNVFFFPLFTAFFVSLNSTVLFLVVECPFLCETALSLLFRHEPLGERSERKWGGKRAGGAG
jgi:hypothetical protein